MLAGGSSPLGNWSWGAAASLLMLPAGGQDAHPLCPLLEQPRGEKHGSQEKEIFKVKEYEEYEI